MAMIATIEEYQISIHTLAWRVTFHLTGKPTPLMISIHTLAWRVTQ
mgnify:CR=1 FL=1